MIGLPTYDEIQSFLDEMRSLMDQGRITTINRSKNMQTLMDLGITWKDAKQEIYELEQSDYVSGPAEDDQRPGTGPVWLFYKELLGHTIYIKLKLESTAEPGVKVFSFHFEGMRSEK